MVIRKKDFLLVPNLLGIFRILLLPFIFYFLAQSTRSGLYVAVLLIALAVFSDVLDGHLARKFNQITDLGKILDPLADKLGMGIFVIFIIFHRGFPLWAACLLFFKDFLTLIGAIALVKRKDLFPMSNNWGKLNSWVWAFTVVFYLVDLNYVKDVFLVLATLTVINCTVQYLRMFFNLYRLGAVGRR
jgi:cardiolipin synthase